MLAVPALTVRFNCVLGSLSSRSVPPATVTPPTFVLGVYANGPLITSVPGPLLVSVRARGGAGVGGRGAAGGGVRRSRAGRAAGDEGGGVGEGEGQAACGRPGRPVRACGGGGGAAKHLRHPGRARGKSTLLTSRPLT